MAKIILHIDMNSYFASVEQQANPHLRGRPVGVCEHLGGIIIAPSVEAKRLGIKLGTPVWEARKIYPKIILLPVDPDKYRMVTAKFLRILGDYTDQVEKASIDEAFVDLTDCCRNYDEALLLGLQIKQRLRQEVGEWVSCSIGIGPNKLIAKIAADLDGGMIGDIDPVRNLMPTASAVPNSERLSNGVDRICIVRPEEVMHLYERLQLTDIPGIAHRLEAALHKLGIFTLKQLASYPLANLLNRFGISGYFLHQMANFEDTAEIVTPDVEEIKSIGHSYTLPRPISDLKDIKKLMFKLAEKVGRRLRRQGASGNVIHYFHSDKRYDSFSRQHKIGELIDDGKVIYDAAWRIMSVTLPLQFPIKIMGVTVSGLRFDSPLVPLFPEYQKPAYLTRAMDLINDKYGEFTIRRGRLAEIAEEWAKDTVGFGRMKEFTA